MKGPEEAAPLAMPLRLGGAPPLLGLGILLVCVGILALGGGAMVVAPGDVVGILLHAVGWGERGTWEPTQEAVVLAIRLPRVVLGILVGGALASAGALMQGLFRNPLADPGLLGVSSGAAFGAALVIVLGTAWAGPSLASWPPLLSLAAFAGGLLATVVVHKLATRDGETRMSPLLLAGIAMNALAGAATGLLTFLSTDQQLRTLTFWTLGSLGGATWPQVLALSPLLFFPILASLSLAFPLNALLLGEAEARHLGIRVEKLKKGVVVLVALLVGTAVAVCGIIGFVGLVVPHLVRLWAGPDHRFLLPASALLGGTLLLGADLLARTMASPQEVPIGIVTSLLGTPFFLALLSRNEGRWG